MDFLTAPARQASSLRTTDHRPWPVPGGSWVQGQTWEDLLFAHWRVPEEVLRPLIPDALRIDTFDGSGWLGVTPFKVTGLRLRGMLPIPGVSSFLELNVRTYVTIEDKPGIWFFSLDAGSQLAVEAARRTYRLPYFHARMSALREGDRVHYECARIQEHGKAFSASYAPVGEVYNANPESLEWFLTERYCLYTHDERRGVARADIHHEPWPLQPAEAEIELNTMPPDELGALEGEPLLHFSGRQDVVIWPLEAVRET